MRTLNNIEMAHVAGAAGDSVPFSVIGSTFVGALVGAFANGALHEIVLSNYQTACESVGGVDCFFNAALYASTHVAPRFVPHVMLGTALGLMIGTAYALSKHTR